jgi:hypothetical protein
MAKKITIRIDEELARKIDELSEKTQIPKVRLTKQAYTLLLALYNDLKEKYEGDVVDVNFIRLLKSNHVRNVYVKQKRKAKKHNKDA